MKVKAIQAVGATTTSTSEDMDLYNTLQRLTHQVQIPHTDGKERSPCQHGARDICQYSRTSGNVAERRQEEIQTRLRERTNRSCQDDLALRSSPTDSQAPKRRLNFFEDVQAGTDSTQMIVSTVEDTISARRVRAGNGALQVLGQISSDIRERLSDKKPGSGHAAGEKSTIDIALTDADICRSSITAEDLETWTSCIESLETGFEWTVLESASDVKQLQVLEQERKSAQKCLQICAQFSDHIDQIHTTPENDSASFARAETIAIPERLTADGLTACKEDLFFTTTKLEHYANEQIDRQAPQSTRMRPSADGLACQSKIQGSWETIRHAKDICRKAESLSMKGISTIDNSAIGDAVQIMVSTEGTTIDGTNLGLGWRTMQVGGHLSEVTAQQISREMSNSRLQA